MLCEPGFLYYARMRDDSEKNVIPWSPDTSPFTHRCAHCRAPVDHVETSNPFLNVMVADKGTNTPHWRKCPKQAWRWSRDD